jgi:hypothetical protein
VTGCQEPFRFGAFSNQGQTVLHPEYGPGKNRRATIQFATIGQKQIILAHSRVRPAR